MKKKTNNLIVLDNFVDPICSMSDSDAGELFKKMLIYNRDGKQTKPSNAGVAFAFSCQKPLIDDQKASWKRVCKANKENGGKGGRPKKKSEKNPMGYNGNPKNPNKIKDNKIKDNKKDSLNNIKKKVLNNHNKKEDN